MDAGVGEHSSVPRRPAAGDWREDFGASDPRIQGPRNTCVRKKPRTEAHEEYRVQCESRGLDSSLGEAWTLSHSMPLIS